MMNFLKPLNDYNSFKRIIREPSAREGFENKRRWFDVF